MCTSHLLTGSPVSRPLGCFHLSAVVSVAAMDTGVRIVSQDPAFNSFGFIPTDGISGSYDKSVFNFLRNHHNVSHVQLDF